MQLGFIQTQAKMVPKLPAASASRARRRRSLPTRLAAPACSRI